MIGLDKIQKMAVSISCPRCERPIDPQARICVHCGVDLALAAIHAESIIIDAGELPPGLPITPEVLVPKIGEYLVEQGILSSADIEKALEYQSMKANLGTPLLLGQALLELDLIEKPVLDEVVTKQIIQLHLALQRANQELERQVQERTQQLQDVLSRLSDLNRLKANFIANISHELRTPLTHIKGYIDILADGGLGTLNPEQSEALTVLKRAENRLEQLIEDLIQFSLASRGELHLNLTHASIEKIILNTLERLRYKALANRVRLDVQLEKPLPEVRADEEKTGWVLFHLLDNAIKFTPEGGAVIILAERCGDHVHISIKDTGIGIPQEKLEEIFEPFHQLDGSTTRKYAGTGLGLAMVRQIIRAHGSDIAVRSIVGQGSQFDFSLPSIHISAESL